MVWWSEGGLPNQKLDVQIWDKFTLLVLLHTCVLDANKTLPA